MKSVRLLQLAIVWAGLAWPAHAQNSASTSSDAAQAAIVKEVQKQGSEDGRKGRLAKSVADLNILYGTEAQKAQVPFINIQSAYQAAYDEGKASRPWWSDFKPSFAWITAAVVALLFVAGEFLKTKVKSAYAWIWEKTYQRLAGTRLFWRVALRRYRAAIERNNRTVKIPFRPDRPLEMDKVFVRLQITGSDPGSNSSVEAAIEEIQASVILGPPGSGKSMLLRKLALDQTRGGGFRRPRIPVLVELNRFNEGGGKLKDRIVAAFAQNDFPNAKRFVEAGLKRGFLFLLFDGLDEVGTERQGDAPSARYLVVEQIRDLIMTYPGCQFVITCRTAVYHGELLDCTKRSLSILEFNDDQIQSFMAAWAPEMPPDKSIEQLLRNLAERPRILALARNPLMLTIIAFLYTDTEFVLPHSRAEFYAKAMSLLLEQWKLKRNRFRGPHKAIILQHLALWNQDSTELSSTDRRTMELEAVLKEIKAVLPTLTLSEEHAQLLLDEITERSGLLVAIDGGQRYQFSHLTLQEFLAAQQLQADANGLLCRYLKAPDDWRETVKLWCGLPHDSTQFIETLRENDAVLAFECVSDAEQVSDPTWRGLLEHFKPRLGFGESDRQVEAIVRTFGIVAADPRPRGQAALQHLKALLDSGTKTNVVGYAAACLALALTNLPHAAQWLADKARTDETARECLVLMGDIAVPVLEPLALPNRNWSNEPDDWPIRALYRIGTAVAVRLLVRVLYDAYFKEFRTAAAWAIASLVSKPAVETALESISVSSPGAAKDWLWVWEPFSPVTSNTTRIMASVAKELVSDQRATGIPDATADLRLAIPHCLIGVPFKVKDWTAKDALMKALAASSDESANAGRKAEWMKTTLESPDAEPTTARMLKVMSDATRFAIMTLDSKCSREQWQNVALPLAYNFKKSWQAAVAITIYVAIALTGVLIAGNEWYQNWPWSSWRWVAWALAMIVVFFAAVPLLAFAEDDDWEMLSVFSLSLVMGAAIGMSSRLLIDGVSGVALQSVGMYGSGIILPGVLTLAVHECRWVRRRTVRPTALLWCLAVVIAPALVASVARGIGIWTGLDMKSLNKVILFPPSVVAAAVTVLVAYMIVRSIRSGADRSIRSRPHKPKLIVMVSLGPILLAAMAYALLICGSYSMVFAMDHAGLHVGAVCIGLAVLFLAHSLGSAQYRTRVASNPFHRLLKGEQEYEGMASIRQRLWGLGSLARGQLKRE